MSVYVVDPLEDGRWDSLVDRHPRASVFHQRGWLEALKRTYGYEPLVITTSRPGDPLENGIALCRVSSWLTGARLVSLPFSDHCEPLLRDSAECEEFIHWAQKTCAEQSLNYVEFRPLPSSAKGMAKLQADSTYWFHELDLEPDLAQIFERLHKNSFQRKIQRAEREGVTCEAGRSERLLDEFYALLQVTRARHRLLPQPLAWFKNIVACLGDSLQIRVARKEGKAIAAVLSLRHRSTVVYKYGCSDESVHNVGAMPLLIWKLIEESKANGARKIDFGRTDVDNEGLTIFKDRLGTSRSSLKYYRYARTAKRSVAALSNSPMLRQCLGLLPGTVRAMAGRILYRHLG